MKKIISCILLVCLVFSQIGYVLADESQVASETKFIKIKIPFPDDIEAHKSWLTRARYKDTGEIIPLSMAYHDSVYATVPIENSDRKIEAFVTEEIRFSDYDNSNPDFHDVSMLSRVGVIRGNEKGEANIYDNVTRAEAVAMVMRFLGLENIQKTDLGFRFDDVMPDDWFYTVVTNAYSCGIIKGDSENTFSPQRDVTREEITVMIARALKYADLRCRQPQLTNNADENEISDWAVEEYKYIGRNVVSDPDITDPQNPVRRLNPQKAATRADVAYILNNTQDDCQLYSSELADTFGFDKEMPVIDGSTSTYPFTQVVYNALFCNGETHPQFPNSHSKSHESYKRLINGEVDMLFASVYPSNEILAFAKEKGIELELIPIAYDAMIFFTNNDNPITGLTKEDITNIYVNNAYDNWSELGGSDANLYPYCRNNDSGSHAQMEKHFLNDNDIHPEIKKETSFTMSNVLTDVISAKTENPLGYGLGYSIYYYYHNVDAVLDTKRHLKLLSIDGVMPNDETIADGTYPLANNTYVVLRKDTPKDSPARKMAEFMLTEAGQICVENAGYGRLKNTAAIKDDMLFADKLDSRMPVDKNYMFSPMSIKMALALSANGASGNTRAEILNAINVSDLDDFNTLSKDLIARYSQTDVLNLNIANSLWINKDKTSQNFSDDYKEIASSFYDADVKTVDNKNAVKEVNSWVSDSTGGKIPRIIESADDFWAMLVNAIYFKGMWQNEFNEAATKPEEFISADGTSSTIDFMNKTGWFSYAKTDSAQILEMPYKNREDKISQSGEYLGSERYDNLDASMYLILPHNNIEAERELSHAINDGAFKRTYVKMAMPKFKIEYETGLNMMLKDIGIVSAFEPENADFNNMFDKGNMWFTNVLHKTYITVDEKGTEAAAVTAIHMAGSALPPEPIELKFNKPFYFVIRDNTSGETLFMGRYAFAA